MDQYNNGMNNNYNNGMQPQYQPQQQYQQAVYVGQQDKEMTVGDWIVTLIILAIPLANIICLIIWAVDSNPDKKSRKNFAIAYLLFTLIAAVLAIIFSSILVAMFAAMLSSYM